MTHNISKWLPHSVHKIGLLVSSFLIVSALLLSHGANAANIAFSGPFDSDSNAVLFGGAANCTQVQQKFAADASAAAIYSFFFIGQPAINNLCNTAVAGQVTKAGQVLVGGKVIATNAMTAGRLNMTGSTKVEKNGVIFFVRPPSVSFLSNSLDAFVVMNNGKFLYAILSSCGNPVAATPVVTPTPAPKPTPTPTPTPTPSTTTVNNTNNNTNTNNNKNTVQVSVANNIQILQQQMQQQTQTQTQTQPQASTTVTPAAAATATEIPAAAAATVLPNTGPGSIVAIFGTTIAVATIGHYFLTRRRVLHS